MRFHTRGILADGRPVIVKVNATDPYEAVTLARRVLLDAQIDPASIVLLKIRTIADTKKSAVYIGKPREPGTSKRGAHLRKGNGTPTTTTAPTKPSAPATPATPAKPSSTPAVPIKAGK